MIESRSVKVVLKMVAIIAFLLLCKTSQVYSEGFFTNREWGARPVGLGGSFVAIADDVNAITWNPAGIARLNHPEVTFMYSQPFSLVDFTAGYAAFAHPLRTGTIGGGWLHYNYLDQATENVFILSYGIQVNEKTGAGSLYLGTTVRYLSVNITADNVDTSLYNTSKSAYTVDLGILYLLSEKITIGFLAKNLNQPDIIFSKQPNDVNNKITIEYNIGVAYNTKIKGNDVVFAVGVLQTDAETNIHLGVEGWKKLSGSRIGLRAGYNIGEYAIGATYEKGPIRIDAVYVIQHHIEGSSGFNISLTYRGI